MGDTRQQDTSPGLSHGPGPGTPVFVDIFYDSNGSEPFKHDWRFEGHPSQGGGPIDIPKKNEGDPGTPIRFQVRSSGNAALKFVDDPKQAIWLDRDKCPQAAGEDPEIPLNQIQPSGPVLTILDRNEEECTIHYRLQFESKGGPLSYDPEIRNGGKTMA